MENKYSSNVEKQINKLLENLDYWRELFSINLHYYQEGWAISLREKNIYPRYIVIFKPYEKQIFNVKSFEIFFHGNKEKFKELYFNENLYDINEVVSEIKQIIYGKDLINIR